jgi:hypothetical protein
MHVIIARIRALDRLNSSEISNRANAPSHRDFPPLTNSRHFHPKNTHIHRFQQQITTYNIPTAK